MDASRSPLSFNSAGKHYNNIKGMKKKRKLLQYEFGSSSLQWPKHKHRDISGLLNHNENSLHEEIDYHSDDEREIMSGTDSNNFVNDCHGNKLSLEMNTDTSTEELSVQEQQEPSQSSASSSNTEILKHNAYSLDSRSTKFVNDRLHVDLGGNHVGIDDAELEGETNTDDLMLYSNNVPPFALASGKWSFGSQDTRLGTMKPTIDQEFEQYFSSLML